MKIQIKNIEKILNQVEEKINGNGGIFQGNLKEGNFSIKGVEGTYFIEGDVCDINITKKPFIVSQSFIENEISKFFEE